MSPYNYSFNNPVMYNDPSGEKGEEAMIYTGTQQSGGFATVPPVDNTAVYQRPQAPTYDLGDKMLYPDGFSIFAKPDPSALMWNSLSIEQRSFQARMASEFDPEILIADMYGHGWIGKQSVVVPIVNSIRQEYVNQVFDNIRNGPFGAAGYLAGGEEGSFKGAVLDQVSLGLYFSPTLATVEPVKAETNFGAPLEPCKCP